MTEILRQEERAPSIFKSILTGAVPRFETQGLLKIILIFFFLQTGTGEATPSNGSSPGKKTNAKEIFY